MSAFRSWLRGSSAPSSSTAQPSHEPSPAVSASTSTTAISAASGSEPLTPAAREIADMHDAMESTSLLLNDDIDGAEARLLARKDDSAFHLLGLGVATFMRAVLGFEKEFMSAANDRLFECEAKAWEEMKRVQREAGTTSNGAGPGHPKNPKVATEVYPPGSEYALIHAEAQVMLAIVAELHESLTEAIKGFYKLRKAFVSLNAIIESEEAVLRGDAGRALHRTNTHMSYTEDPMPGAFDIAEFADLEAEAAAEEVAGNGAAKNAAPADSSTATSATASSVDVALSEKAPSTIRKAAQSTAPSVKAAAVASLHGSHRHVLDTLTNPADIFVHSGANMCFGMMQLIISMVPPAFSRLLSIVGFRGDRERGVRMLWQSTKFTNINAGIAGLVLLAYYNGMMAYADVLPCAADIAELADPGEVVGYPKERCEALLTHMRNMYPDSLLWVLEEARLLATKRQVHDAIRVLKNSRVAKMRQITAVTKFELGLDAMCAMDWPLLRDAFLQCVELNSWSHALYYYFVGCAEIELYRTAFHRAAELAADPDKVPEKGAAEADAAKHKKAAEEHLRKAPTMAGKKKFMARQMPFDLFVIRKVARWEERAKAHGIALADAVGVSPALEMAYLWNGSKRMSPDLLEQALACLDWTRCTADASVVDVFKAAPDESAIGSLCRANLLRSLGRLAESQEVLEKELLCHDR